MDQKNAFVILVVDDEPINLDIIDDCLKPAGYKTVLFENPVKALNALNSGLNPDLIVSDLNMPEINGFQFYEEVQKLKNLDLVPFIFLTSMFDEENIRYGKELGADDYLKKPFKNPDLISCIRGKLRKAKKVSSNVNQEMDKLKENILQMLSHELRTPVTSLVGYAEILGDGNIELSAEELREFSDMIKQGGDRIKNLTEDFFESLSFETGDMVKTYNSLKNSFELAPVIDSIITERENDLGNKNLTVIKNYSNNINSVFGCQPQITNMLKRIFDNAIKFNDKGKSIQITLNKKNDRVFCSIADEGRGILSDEIPKIYNKFYQVNRDKHEQQGSGLGLYIARNISSVNNCNIICDSFPGKGTTFSIEIPTISLL